MVGLRTLAKTIIARLPVPAQYWIKWTIRCLATYFARKGEQHITAPKGEQQIPVLSRGTPASMDGLVSQMVTVEQMRSDVFNYWADCLKHPIKLDRKLWEFVYALQALRETGNLAPGRRGLGFGVGGEPIIPLMVNNGCRIVLTNQNEEKARDEGWVKEIDQYVQFVADPSEILRFNHGGLSDSKTFQEEATYRDVDMNFIPEDLRGFDLVWSLCAMEHLGSLANGIAFVHNSLKCLKPGGVAVHTTEFNLSSDENTVEEKLLVLYRRRDLLELATDLANQGHLIDLNFDPGDPQINSYVDTPPYRRSVHSKIYVGEYVTTSFGLIIRKNPLDIRGRRL